MRSREKASSVAFVSSLTLATATRICLPFDGLYGQDAFAYFGYGASLSSHLTRGTPLPDLYWPIGYPVTLALLLPLTAGGPLAGQIVSAFSCALAAAATSLVVRELRRNDRARGENTTPELVAGLVAALSGASLRNSQVVMADALALGATAAALLCVIRYAQTRHGPWLLACVVALAWGTASRWMVGLLVVPMGVFLTLSQCHGPGRLSLHAGHGGGPSATASLWVAAACIAGLAILIPVVVVAHGSPASLEKHEWLVGWSVRNAVQFDFHTPEGHAIYRLPPALFYLLRLAWPDYFFPLLVPFVLAGAWTLLRERLFSNAVLLLGWPATVWLFLSGIPYENPRFLLPTLPAIAALVGIGFARARELLGLRLGPALGLTVAISLAAGLGFGVREHARLVARKNADRELVAWLGSRLPQDANLLVGGPTSVLRHYSSINTHELFDVGDADVTALIASRERLFVLANVEALKQQWLGLPAQQSIERLRANPGLKIVGVHPPYTLFEANARDSM